jgi:hypothetical protein
MNASCFTFLRDVVKLWRVLHHRVGVNTTATQKRNHVTRRLTEKKPERFRNGAARKKLRY